MTAMNSGVGDESSVGAPAEAESDTSHLSRALDDLVHRFDRLDWVELAATVVLSLAVLVASWSAYQASLWGGVQSANASQYTGQLTESSEITTLITAQFEADAQTMSTWLVMAADDNERGMQILEERFGVTLRPAFDAWIAGSVNGEVPPGVPQDLPEYETGFTELANRWMPILNAFDEVGVDVCYELHPGEDLHDGITFEMFLEKVGGHKRANILYDPSHFVLQ